MIYTYTSSSSSDAGESQGVGRHEAPPPSVQQNIISILLPTMSL